ncbi:MAG: hypothetical protein H6707_05425 [Deltaproteobacteria bacterium]|nr:hypothetical protein [Deltaproteobacteria bacterium]
MLLRLNNGGLQFAADQIKTRLSGSYTFSISEEGVQAPNVSADLSMSTLSIEGVGDELSVRVLGDLRATGDVQISSPQASCYADLDLRGIDVRARLKVSTVDGRKTISVDGISLDVDREETMPKVSGCWLGTVIDIVRSVFKRRAYDYLLKRLSQKLTAELPVALESKLNELGQISGDVSMAHYDVELEALNTRESGVEAMVGGRLDFVARAAGIGCALPQEPSPVSCGGATPTLRPEVASMFGISISEALVQDAVSAYWRAGWMCMTSAELLKDRPELQDKLNGMLGALGLSPESDRIDFALHIHAPPRVAFGNKGASIGVEKVTLEIFLRRNGGTAERLSVGLGFSADLALLLSPMSGSINVELQQANLSQLEISGDRIALELDEERLKRYIQTIVLPMLRERLDGLDFTPPVLGVKGFLFEPRLLSIGGGALAVYFNVAQPKTDGDRQAPRTVIARGLPQLIGPQLASIYVNGEDDLTPSSLLRYRYRIDGGAWSEVSYRRRIDVPAEQGQHVVEIAAVDQAGNQDDSPALVNFEVDASPPELKITQQPADLVEVDYVDVAFVGWDSRTATQRLAYQAELFSVAEGQVKRVAQHPYVTGRSTIRFADLRSGVYRAVITVRDEAGNVGSQTVGFVVHRAAGCAVSVADNTAAGTMLGLFVLLVVGRLRRRTRM